MAKIRYQFNTKSLEIEKVRITLKDRLRQLVFYVIAGIVFSAGVMLISYSFFESPSERVLKRENEQYRNQVVEINRKIGDLEAVLTDIAERDNNIYRLVLEAEPISESERKASFGGADRYAHLEGYDNSRLIIDTRKRVDVLSRQLYVQSKSFDEVYQRARTKARMLSSIPAIMPISNRELTRIASGFGFRLHPIYKTWRMHTGIDFTAPTGTPIYATGDGSVIRPNQGMSGYGLTCVIDHGYSYQTLYGHLSKMIVRPGQKVKRGEIIGYVGSSGTSTGPHLHYEVIKDGVKINPVHFFFNDLSPEEYEKVLELASRRNQALSF
jgi:murein DD-endopeptidase MepM/ murein hydrolase activator NlpD